VRLLSEREFDVVASVGDAPTLLAEVEQLRPDVVVVDIRMPPTQTTEGLDAAKEIRSSFAPTGVLVLSQHVETHHALELLDNPDGGVGYLLKDRVSDLGEFCDAVRRVGEGGSAIDPLVVSRLLARRREHDPLDDLTKREREILGLMAEGHTNAGIGGRLFLAPKTVETHVHRIFWKLGLLPTGEGHRRVLAVLAHLRGAGG
jgi:DNA-binding NarL/FixJ family response regulator